MLRPFLDVAQFWRVPDDARGQFGQTHFARRAEERGVTCLPGWALHWAVCHALRAGCSDVIERVFAMRNGSVIYRILLPEGAFYPVVNAAGVVTTIYTQDILRKAKRGRMVARLKRVPRRWRLR